MLPPDYLSACGDALLHIFEEYQTSLINDMARRLAKFGVTDASVWQVMAYQEAGGVYDDAIVHLARLTGQTQQELRQLFDAAGAKAMQYDDEVYRAAGLTPIPLSQSPGMLRILTAGLQKTKGALDNWTMTTAITAQQSFIGALNGAYLQVVGGGMAYDAAIKGAVRQMARDGLYVLYPSGHRDKIDVATRRAVLSGVNQTVAQMSLAHAQDMGCDHVEVTAHYGARPSHAEWQGGVYQLSTGEFERVTGYGTGPGLCGWNCRHNFYPFLYGVNRRTYSADDLRDMEQAAVRYNGEDIHLYDATQMQRGMEREIRALKREWQAVQSAEAADMGITDYSSQYQEVGAKLRQQREALKAFEAQTGLSSQAERTQVLGFGRSEASTATWAARKAETLARNIELSYNKAAEEFRAAIQSGAQSLRVIPQRQAPHLVNSAIPGKSYIIGEMQDAQNLITRYAGTGLFDKDGKGRFTQKEIVHTDMPIGVAAQQNGDLIVTSMFKIHYRKTGTHIVPKKEVK